MLLIPAIDLRGGRCVRLVHGDFAAERSYDIEAHELLVRYRELGASWIHVVDLDGARDGRQANQATIATLASQPAVRLQVGGGIRNAAAIDAQLRSGVNRVVLGSCAVTEPDSVCEWVSRFGANRIVLAFDVRIDDAGVPRCCIEGWQTRSDVTLWDALARFRDTSLEHVLCTDVGRDGALAGPNDQLYRDAVRRFPRLQWQASGGIRDAQDLRLLRATGVAAAISGRALLEERIAASDLQPYLRSDTAPGEQRPFSRGA
jgi:phosphoribosylformimino-5-aminoimidazole carboxamide ribotide isomerase